MEITFRARFKEELLCVTPRGTLVFDFPWGVPAVYFPTEAKWDRMAPAWARDLRDEILPRLREWCERNSVPLVVDQAANVITEYRESQR